MQPGQPGNPGDPRVTRRVPAVQPGPQPAFELPVLPDTSATAATAAQMGQIGQMSGRYTPGPAGRMPASLGVSAMTGMTGANAMSGMTGSAPAVGVLPSRSLPPSPSVRPQAAPPAAAEPHADTAFGPREPTLTQRMRSLQPPDVARQAMSELGVLARELATLPEALEVAGLARTHQSGYFDSIRLYLGLTRQAWESVAEERLEQSGADPEYRQRAIAVARRVGQLQQEARAASDNDLFQLPRRRPFLWTRRVGLVRAGLTAWQDRLSPTPDPLEMGRGLFLLRGFLGLASAGRTELSLLDLLTGAPVALLSLVGLGFLLLLAQALIAGTAATAISMGAAALVSGMLLMLTLLLGVNGPAPIGLLLGASVFTPTRSTRNARLGGAAAAGLLRGWWLAIGGLGAALLLAALLIGGTLIGSGNPIAPPTDLQSALGIGGSLLVLALILPAAISLTALLALALPVLVAAAARGAAEVAGGIAWVPAARRYALEPGLAVLAALTSLLAVVVWLVTNALGWQDATLLSLDVNTATTFALSVRGVLLLLALALPYALLIELPYRLGIRRWRRSLMRDLGARRLDVESHVRRLSAVDPRSGNQDTSEENLRAMQYDLVLLQFYQGKIDETERTGDAPFRLRALLVAFVVIALCALLLDAGAHPLAQLLVGTS